MDDSDLPQKLAVQRESLRVLDEAARISPKNLTLHMYRALVHLHLGESMTVDRKLEEARVAYLESAAICESYQARAPASLFVMLMRANQRLA